MRKNIGYAYILGGLVLIATGVYGFFGNNTVNVQDGSSDDGSVTIVTSFYPLYYFVSEITGDSAEVINIGEGLDPHDFRPSAQDILRMQQADLVVFQGAGLESWSEDMEEQLRNEGGNVLVMAEHTSVSEHDHEEEDAHAEDEDTHMEDDEHVHYGKDPHTWLDPVLAAEAVRVLTDRLVDTNPAASEVYRNNEAALIDVLLALDAEYRSGLMSCGVSGAIISHHAFGYIEKRYNLTMYPIAGISSQDEPSAQLLATLKEKTQEGVTTVLTDQTKAKDYAETLSRETGLQLLPIDPISAGPLSPSKNYVDAMRSNLQSLIQAYECTPRT